MIEYCDETYFLDNQPGNRLPKDLGVNSLNPYGSTTGAPHSLALDTQGSWRGFNSRLAQFQRILSERDLHQSTIRSYIADIQQYIGWVYSRQSKDSIIQREDAMAYLDYLMQSMHQLRPNRIGKYALTTIVKKLYSVQKFHEFLHKECDFPTTPFRDIFDHVPNARQRDRISTILPVDTICLLISTCDVSTPKGTRDRSLLLLISGLGIRVGEIHQLDVGDIDVRDRSIRINAHQAKPRRLPLTEPLFDALSRWISVRAIYATRQDALFVSLHHNSVNGAPGLRLSHRGIRSVVEKSLARIGVTASGGGPSLLRRSAIHHVIAGGANLNGIQSLFGITTKSFIAYKEYVRLICRIEEEGD